MCTQGFSGEASGKETTWKTQASLGIILRWNFRKWDVGDMDWIDLAQDRYRWRALENAVVNLRVP
jgi:hypothetical protein